MKSSISLKKALFAKFYHLETSTLHTGNAHQFKTNLYKKEEKCEIVKKIY